MKIENFSKDDLLGLVKRNLDENKSKKLTESADIQRVLNPADADAFEQHEEALKQNAERKDPENYDDDVKELIKDTASEESRYRHFDVVDRKDLAKRINEAKEKGQQFKVSRNDKIGYRYALDILTEALDDAKDIEEVPVEARKELTKADDKVETLCEIIGRIENLLDYNTEEDKKADAVERAKKIIQDLVKGFDIDFEELKKAYISNNENEYKLLECDMKENLADKMLAKLGLDPSNEEDKEESDADTTKDEDKESLKEYKIRKTVARKKLTEAEEDDNIDDVTTYEEDELEVKEPIYSVIPDDFKPSVKAADFWKQIEDADKVEVLDASLEMIYPEGISSIDLDTLLYTDPDFIKDLIGLDAEDEDEIDLDAEPVVDEDDDWVDYEDVDLDEPIDIEDVEEVDEEEDFDKFDDYDTDNDVVDLAKADVEEKEEEVVEESCEKKDLKEEKLSDKIMKELGITEDLDLVDDESLNEGKNQIYQEIENEYFDALAKAEKLGNVSFTVNDEEFDTFEEASDFAKESGLNTVEVSSFSFEGPDGYDNGDYEEYNKAVLDLNKNIIKFLDESLKESRIKFEDFSDDELLDYIVDNFKKITGKEIDSIFNKYDEDKEDQSLFNQDSIDATVDKVKDFLMTKAKKSEIEAEELFDDLDDKLTNYYHNMFESLKEDTTIKMDGVECTVDNVEIEKDFDDGCDKEIVCDTCEDDEIDPIIISDEDVEDVFGPVVEPEVKVEKEIVLTDEQPEEIVEEGVCPKCGKKICECDNKEVKEDIEILDSPDADDELTEKLGNAFVEKTFKAQEDLTDPSITTQAAKAVEAAEDEDEIVAIDDNMVNEMLGAPTKEDK